MSTKIGAMYHPVNGSAVETYAGFNWPVLFFGCFWYGLKGMWGWAVLAFFAAMCTMGLSWFVFPFVANGQHVAYLRRQGYLTKDQYEQARAPRQVAPTAAPIDTAAAIEKFAALREKGLLTEEEFNQQKQRLLRAA